jgi:hypothetical protein
MDLHHGNQTHFDLWLHGKVAKGKIHQQDRDQQTIEISLPGHNWGDENNSTAAKEVHLELSSLHVIDVVEAKAAIKTYVQPSVETQNH